MPSSVTIAGLSHTTSDGRTLFTGLDLSFGPERTGLIGRNGVGKSTLAALILGAVPPQSGSIHVAGTIGHLRQSLQPEPGETIARLFGIEAGLARLDRAARAEADAADLAEADWTLPARLEACLARFGLSADPATPLAALSGGERTRAGLAALLFAGPDILVLDEPTNNLDRDGRRAVIDLLSGWRKAAIVISHDRELLETMDAIIELTSIGARRHGGNFSQYRAAVAIERAAAARDLSEAEKRLAQVARTARSMEEKQARRDRGGRQKAERGGMPAILAGGLTMRAEETAAGSARLRERQRAEAEAELAAARARFEVLDPLSAAIAPCRLPAGRLVVSVKDLVAGPVPGRPVIRNLSFDMTGPERVAVTGPNGSGKTTLLAALAGRLVPEAGHAAIHVPFAMLDQTVSVLDPALSILDNARALNPDAGDNACRAVLARFMFRADAALQPVGTLSGGQRLRAGLACVLGGRNPPQLVILDEPTNHLDLDSVAAIEAGLKAYDGALLVVSHDPVFLAEIGVMRMIAMAG